MNAEDNPLPQYDFLAGATLLVDKPQGWTSFDVVNKIRYKIKHRLKVKKIKVGHAGTLDPMATGLLIVCTGKFTKKLAEFQGLPKEYTGTLRLGATTPSFDAESDVEESFPIDHITPELLEQARLQFLGDIEQVPPMFSAIKVDGQPLYKKARKGEMVEIEPRPVTINEFTLTRIELPEVGFRVHCSKGTYIRSLAHDFGKAVRSGAYLTALRRARIGQFRIEDAWDLEELVDYLEEVSVVAEGK
ncbi:MAG: tRNA pseudouridine(55) synthase TruB [Lewinellaceae bacterium]|nr:tRNA pseudouridine(55) synthase TruB [Phaeodactylibacter sp.]MCB9041328.1 tRNA pseudouridine(55) synthase TruB [Lewinellaceae bacterium]